MPEVVCYLIRKLPCLRARFKERAERDIYVTGFSEETAILGSNYIKC